MAVDVNRAARTCLLLVLAAIASCVIAGMASSVALADAPTVGTPSWWNGDCDAGGYAGAHHLGATWNGLIACGPRPITDGAPDRTVRFFPGAWGEFEWECVELSMRWLYQAYGVHPYSANGFDIVDNYTSADGGGLVKIANGSGHAPQPGDVIEFRSADHTGVVTSSSVDGAGNGSITIIEQNAMANGWGTYSVRSWSVSGATDWLDKPGGSGGGGTNPPPAPSSGPTSMTYTGASDGDYNHQVTLSARLVDDLTSGGLAGRSIGFTLGAQTCSASTDSAGDASCSLALRQTPGDYTVTASFGGDGTYQASSDGHAFTIHQAATRTSYGGPASAEYYAPFTAAATLIESDGGAPVAGRTISFKLGASDVCSAVTDASGTAACALTPTQPVGTYSIVASFGPDALYVASSDVKAFAITRATTVTRVTAVPPGSSTFGQLVTFTARSAAASQGAPAPTGTTAFTVDGHAAGSISLTSGSASTRTTSLAAGSHVVTAAYAGDHDFLPSSGDLPPYTVTCTVKVNGIHPGALTVTSSTCLGEGARVDGSVMVKPGGALDVEGASIGGALKAARGAGVIRVCGSSVGGTLDIKDAGDLVMVGDSGDGCSPNQIGGSMLVKNNTNGVEAIGNTAGGAIVTTGDSGPGPYTGDATTVSGNHPAAASRGGLGTDNPASTGTAPTPGPAFAVGVVPNTASAPTIASPPGALTGGLGAPSGLHSSPVAAMRPAGHTGGSRAPTVVSGLATPAPTSGCHKVAPTRRRRCLAAAIKGAPASARGSGAKPAAAGRSR
jgi:hypothetical protein